MSCRHLVLTRKAEEQKYAGPPKWPLRGTRPDRGARRGGSSSPPCVVFARREAATRKATPPLTPSATLEGPAPRTRQNAPTRISNREYLHIIQTHHKAHRQMSLLFEEFRFRPIAQTGPKEGRHPLQPAVGVLGNGPGRPACQSGAGVVEATPPPSPLPCPGQTRTGAAKLQR